MLEKAWKVPTTGATPARTAASPAHGTTGSWTCTTSGATDRSCRRNRAMVGRRRGDGCHRAVERHAQGPADRGHVVAARAEQDDLVAARPQRGGQVRHVRLDTAGDLEVVGRHERHAQAAHGCGRTCGGASPSPARASARQSPPSRQAATTGCSGSRSASQLGTKTCHCSGANRTRCSSSAATAWVPS